MQRLYPNKAEELAMLGRWIEEATQFSYLGPALTAVRCQLETEIANDYPVDLVTALRDAKANVARLEARETELKAANLKAEETLKQSNLQAARADHHAKTVRHTLETALAAIYPR